MSKYTKPLWLSLLLMSEFLWASTSYGFGDSITLYLIPPRSPMNYESPSTLAISLAGRSKRGLVVEGKELKKDAALWKKLEVINQYEVGHTIIEINCEPTNEKPLRH